MKATLLMAISLWITFALVVAIAVMARGSMDGISFGLLVFAGLTDLVMAIRCTRSYRRGEAFPIGWQPEGGAGLARRERVRARIAAARNPR